MNIEDVEGIGPENAGRLRGAGIATTDALLDRGASAAGRSELAAAAGVSPKLVLEWVNHVDLMRIDGVGSEYSDLLEAAGVDSPAELAQRNAANLAQTFQELDAARPNWIRSLPSEATVEKWIAQAKALPKIVTHGGADGSGGSGGSGGSRESLGSGATTKAGNVASPASGPATTRSPIDVADAAAADPVAFAPRTESPPRTSAAASTASPGHRGTDEGIWARIKRMFGG